MMDGPCRSFKSAQANEAQPLHRLHKMSGDSWNGEIERTGWSGDRMGHLNPAGAGNTPADQAQKLWDHASATRSAKQRGPSPPPELWDHASAARRAEQRGPSPPPEFQLAQFGSNRAEQVSAIVSRVTKCLSNRQIPQEWVRRAAWKISTRRTASS